MHYRYKHCYFHHPINALIKMEALLLRIVKVSGSTSTRRPATLSDGFRDFPRVFRHSGAIHLNRPRPLSFQFIRSLISRWSWKILVKYSNKSVPLSIRVQCGYARQVWGKYKTTTLSLQEPNVLCFVPLIC